MSASAASQPSPGADLRGVTDAVLRAGFLRKVYGILATQMILTVAVSIASMYTPLIHDTTVAMFKSNNCALQVAIFIPTVLSLLFLQFGASKHYPWNYLLLFTFTLCKSVNVGFICVIHKEAGLGSLILEAFAITAVIFLALTAYALYSGKDFSYMRGFLTTALLGLVCMGFLGLFFRTAAGSLALAFFGAITFCGYILFDTWQLEKVHGYDDYIQATIQLYLDIINLFLYILKILHKLSKKDD